MRLRINMTEHGPLSEIIKKVPQNLSVIVADAIIEWHKRFFPKRFDSIQTVRSRYPSKDGVQVFKARSRNYAKRKAKKYGHTRVLDFTGTTRREMTSSINVVMDGKGGGTGFLNTSRNLFLAGKHDLIAELTITNEQEETELAEYVGDRLEGLMNKDLRQKRTELR